MGLGDLSSDEDDEPEEVEAEVVEEGSDQEAEEVTLVEPSTPAEENTLLRPAADIDDVAALYDQFEKVKEKLLTNDDIQTISGRKFVKKSGWRKIATAFNLSVDSISERVWVEDGIVKAEAKARATAPNGKSATDVARATSTESNFMEVVGEEDKEDDDVLHVDNKWRRIRDPRIVSEHDVLTLAVTRAKNRAISDCVGGGDVSAEEVDKSDVFG